MVMPRSGTTDPARVVLFGLGAVGSCLLRCLDAGYPLIRIVGAVDKAPDKGGQPLEVLHPGPGAGKGVVVKPSLAECLAGLDSPPDVVFHMTESVPDQIEGQLTEALDAGASVISASEAMFHPTLRYPAFAERLDKAAKAAGVSITGVGINPGFSFDALPLMLSRVTSGVSAVHINRCIDVTGTGPGDIDHVGYLLTPEEFDARIASGRIQGHIGMPESIAALAERLGLAIDRIEEEWETEIADGPVDSGVKELGMIPPGRVIGITQSGRGMRGDEAVITMRLVMYYDPVRFGLTEGDEIEIVGAHHIRASLKPAAVSIFGAANWIVNAVHDVLAAPPGLVNVLDLSIGGVRRGGFRYATDPARPPKPGLMALTPVAVT